jgi:uncharacterized protein
MDPRIEGTDRRMTETGDVRRVAISGAGGFIGHAVARSFAVAGWTVERLVRRQAGPGEISWDPDAGRVDRSALEGITAFIHLAGEPIAGIWTEAKKRRILESRARGTRLVAESIAALRSPPRILVSASGVGYYGDAGERLLTEDSPPGEDFLARVCREWERGTDPAADAGIRVVNTRFGIVLDPEGGALGLMLPAFRLGLGGKLGSGRQWMSWIGLRDAARVVRFAVATESLAGPVNATSPAPVRNAEFTRALGGSLRRPAFLAVPAVALRTFTGGMADSLLLASQRAVPAALERHGFRFEAPDLEDVLP